MDKALACIARGHGDQWEAFCLDFDLAVQARSFDDARTRLVDAVVDYVETAMKEPEPVRSRLLRRRAPLRVRLAWAARLFLATVARPGSRPKDPPIGFPVACPA
jgi:hypothetical protein